jgi:hypothetical protein
MIGHGGPEPDHANNPNVRCCATGHSMLGSLSVDDVRDGRWSPTASSSDSPTAPRRAIFAGG